MERNTFPANLDHLIYTAPTLEKGMDAMESLLGVRPIIGGQHSNWGTHNALLSIGDSIYLEVLAPDPSLPTPERGKWLAAHYQRSTLVTWVLRTKEIEALQAKAVQRGIPMGEVEAGKRAKPDGTMLSWKLTDPYALPLQGAIPFLISWGDSQHPATVAPKAGELLGFKIGHPQPDQVTRHLEVLGVQVDVFESEHTQLLAHIETENGLVKLS